MATSEGDIRNGVLLLLKKYGSLTTSEVKKLLHTVMVFDDDDMQTSVSVNGSRKKEPLIMQRIGNVVSHQDEKIRDYYDAYRVDKTSGRALWSILTGLQSEKTLDVISEKEIQRRKVRARTFKPRKINWQEVSHHRTKLGFSGEKFVISYEIKRVFDFAPQDLGRIIHLSEEQGDGAGFDIISLNHDGSDKYIEVKTTTDGADTPFYMTENERAYFNINKDEDNLFIYRVFNFNMDNNEGEIMIISAKELFARYDFDPISYKVSKTN